MGLHFVKPFLYCTSFTIQILKKFQPICSGIDHVIYVVPLQEKLYSRDYCIGLRCIICEGLPILINLTALEP